MLSKTELQTLASIASNLNFYQILKISVVAPAEEIKAAFHREALNLHPDRYLPLGDIEAVNLAKSIYSKLVEAYRTLSNRKKREEYDQNLQMNQALKGARISGERFKSSAPNSTSGPQPAMTPPATTAEREDDAITAVRHKPVGATTTAGVKFYKLAQVAFQSKDFSAARVNIQIALNTDPKNPEFLEFSERLQMEMSKRK